MGAQMLRRTVRPSLARPGCIEMFKQIVVGVDEHEGGRDAIALARHLLARDGQLTLAHVLPHDGHGYRGRSAAYEASGWASAAQLLEMVREETGVDAHLRWRVSGSAGRGLHELCELIGADLLAVGSSRRGLLGCVLMSDDTPAALNGAPCATAIAPANYSHEPVAMREIGVGYNGARARARSAPSCQHSGKALGVRGRRAFDQPVQSRTRGGTEGVSIAVRLSRTRSSVTAPSRTAPGAVECSDRGCSQ